MPLIGINNSAHRQLLLRMNALHIEDNDMVEMLDQLSRLHNTYEDMLREIAALIAAYEALAIDIRKKGSATKRNSNTKNTPAKQVR